MMYHTEKQYKEKVIKLVDLLSEFDILTEFDPHMHDQLKAIEEEHGLDHGYEKIRADYTSRKASNGRQESL